MRGDNAPSAWVQWQSPKTWGGRLRRKPRILDLSRSSCLLVQVLPEGAQGQT